MSKTTNDKQIESLLKKVKEQKDALGIKPKSGLTTNGLFKYGNGEHFNLNTVTDSGVFVRALALMMQQEKYQKEAAEILGVTAPEFEISGFKICDWVEDFMTRIAIVAYDNRNSVLKLTEKNLKNMMSEDAKTKRSLGEIEGLLK